MPSVSNALDNASTIPVTYFFAEIKQDWNDSWQFVPYLTPLDCTDASAPEISSATLEYDFGSIKREDATDFTLFAPEDIRDWFVRISCQFPGADPQVLFVGIIVSEEDIYGSPTVLMGKQHFTAKGLGYLLDREQILSSRVCETGTNPSEISWVPTFNRRSHRGIALLGNRTTEVTDDKVYAFQSNGEMWSYLDIANYLLKYYAPPDVTFKIKGTTDPLDEIKTVFDVNHTTVWQALNRMVDQRRGLGFRLQVQGNTVNIVVFTLTDFPISVGEESLPANTNQTSLDLPSDYPYSHLVGDVPFLTTSTNTFDKIIVQGNRILMMGIFSFYDNTLVKGWNDAIEQEYLTAAGGNDETANDIYREADRYDSVFTTFKVPRTWDFTLGNGAGTAQQKQNVAPNPQEDGNIRFNTPGSYWIGQKHFERSLPLRVDYDYTQNPPKDNTVTGTEDEWMLPLVWMFDAYSGPNHTGDKKWHAVHKMHATNPDLKNIHVTLLDNELGFKLEGSPKHYLALNHWTGAQQSTEEPEIDYTTLAITAAFKTDQRQNIVLYNQSGQTEAMKTLTLTIDHAECWLAASPDTPVGIDTKGNPLLINGENLILRNDVTLLKAVAALASAWYGVKRQAVEIPIHNIGLYVELGTLLTSISSIYQRESVRTVVTRRHVDFKSRQTVISTGYFEMDFAHLAGKIRDS